MSAIPTRMVVHALVREDGTVAGEELYEVAALLGMTDQQVRLCVKRLVTEGRFTVEGRGRRAVLRLAGTEQGPRRPSYRRWSSSGTPTGRTGGWSRGTGAGTPSPSPYRNPRGPLGTPCGTR